MVDSSECRGGEKGYWESILGNWEHKGMLKWKKWGKYCILLNIFPFKIASRKDERSAAHVTKDAHATLVET